MTCYWEQRPFHRHIETGVAPSHESWPLLPTSPTPRRLTNCILSGPIPSINLHSEAMTPEEE
jgi:hypothetical protein